MARQAEYFPVEVAFILGTSEHDVPFTSLSLATRGFYLSAWAMLWRDNKDTLTHTAYTRLAQLLHTESRDVHRFLKKLGKSRYITKCKAGWKFNGIRAKREKAFHRGTSHKRGFAENCGAKAEVCGTNLNLEVNTDLKKPTPGSKALSNLPPAEVPKNGEGCGLVNSNPTQNSNGALPPPTKPLPPPTPDDAKLILQQFQQRVRVTINDGAAALSERCDTRPGGDLARLVDALTAIPRWRYDRRRTLAYCLQACTSKGVKNPVAWLVDVILRPKFTPADGAMEMAKQVLAVWDRPPAESPVAQLVKGLGS